MVRKLSASELKVLTHLPIPMVIVLKTKIRWINFAFQELFGPTADIVGYPITRFQHPDYRKIQTRIGKAREAGLCMPEVYDSLWIDMEDHEIPVTIKGELIFYEGENAVLAYVLNRSRLESYDKEISLELNILQSMNQLSMVRNMINGLRHNINNFLTQITMGIEHFEVEDKIDQVICTEMKGSIQQIQNTVSFLNLFSGSISPRSQEVDIVAFLGEITAKYENTLFEPPQRGHWSLGYVDPVYLEKYIQAILSFYHQIRRDETPLVITLHDGLHAGGIVTVNWTQSPEKLITLKMVFGPLIMDPLELFDPGAPFNLNNALVRGTNPLVMTELLRSMGIGQIVEFKPDFIIQLILPKSGKSEKNGVSN